MLHCAFFLFQGFVCKCYWPLIILGLPPLFLEMSVCRLMYHGISILICPNMLCAMWVDSACGRILWKLRQQRGLKMALVYVTNVLVKMNMFRTRCMLFYFVKTIERVCELRKHFSFLFTPFFEDFSAAQPFLLQQVNNQLVHDFLSQQNTRLFLDKWGEASQAMLKSWRSLLRCELATCVCFVRACTCVCVCVWACTPSTCSHLSVKHGDSHPQNTLPSSSLH